MNDRVMDRVVMQDGCWGWTGSHTTAGYGNVWADGKVVYVHRLLYQWFVGPIPEGFDIDHLCRNRGCCNPAHLEAVSHVTNCRRGVKGELTTHCRKGHEFTEANTYVHPTTGHRKCRACRREGKKVSPADLFGKL